MAGEKHTSLIKHHTLIALIVLYSVPGFGQSDTELLGEDLNRMLFGHNHVSFSFTSYVVNKANTTRLGGNYHIKTIYADGFELSGGYNINFSKDYSLIVGIATGIAARRYRLHISKYQYSPNLQYDVNEVRGAAGEIDSYLAFPIWIEKRWLQSGNSYWALLGGLNIRHTANESVSIESIYPDVNGQIVEVVKINYIIGDPKVWINYNVGGGYAILLRNHNYLSCDLVANFSGTKIIKGTYTVNVSGNPISTGTYSANLSYIGVSFSYIFTGANKRLLKRREDELPTNKNQ